MEKTYTQEEVARILLNQKSRDEFINDIIEDTKERAINERYDNYLKNEEKYYGHMMMPTQNVQKITREEYKLLEFCHNTNMKEFLKEEFKRNPISSKEAQESYERMMLENTNY